MAQSVGPIEADINRVLDLYADMVRRICYLHLKQRADVEDVFQDVFLKYMQRQEPFDNEEHEKAWLIRVAVNSCKDLRKSFWHSRMGPLDENLAAQIPVESHELLDAVLKLPTSERTAIYLFYYEGYSVPEIAKMLRQKPNTIYSHLHRARHRLGEHLGGVADEK
ncbi:MAG: sigma-70 family RNA polymerase sigma factor [Bacillota bacterium]|nr:sigma-70 family RNA polymerase sigma factor [Bacillota bacterium]